MKLGRRAVLAGAAVGMASMAGCMDLISGETVEFTASEAAVSDAGLDETEYAHLETEELTIDEQVEAGGIERQLVVTNWINTYEKDLTVQGDVQQAATFAVVSTPSAELLGRSLNPIAQLSHEELLDEFQNELGDDYDGVDDIELVEEREEIVLEQEELVSTFETTTEFEGEEVEIYIHVATVTNDEDLIIAVGAHPAALGQERTNSYTLMREIEHGV